MRSTRSVAGCDGVGDAEALGTGDGVTTGGTTEGSLRNQPPTAAPATAAASNRPSAATRGSGCSHPAEAEPAAPHRVATERGEGIAAARVGPGMGEDRVDRALRNAARDILEPRGDAPVLIVRSGHAERSFPWSVRAWASSVARRAWLA